MHLIAGCGYAVVITATFSSHPLDLIGDEVLPTQGNLNYAPTGILLRSQQ